MEEHPTDTPTVTLRGVQYPIVLPGPSICRDLLTYYHDNSRRAQLAALGVCVTLPALPPVHPPRLEHQPLGRDGLRQCRGNLWEFAERVEARLMALEVPYAEQLAAGGDCWTLAADAVLPGLTEAVSRVDFGDAGAAATSKPSASA